MPKTLQTIITNVKKLKQKTLPYSADLATRVIQADRAQVLNSLTELFNEYTEEGGIQCLEAYLAAHWEQTNGTLLAYTALPNCDVTHLLCDIASYVAAYKPRKLSDSPKGALHYLMPTLNLESFDDGYPDLCPCEGNGYEDVELSRILNEHVLGDRGQYLIPIDYLLRVSLEGDSNYLNNAYYDYQAHDESNGRLNEDEIRRLRHHSDVTEQLLLAKEQYELLTGESNSLYSHLRRFCHQLYFNSVDGVGKEKYAGNAAYVAIPQFFDYYEKLDDSALKKVPSGVKKALARIKHFGSDKATIGDIGSCLATRRQDLEAAMKGKEEILLSIAIDGEIKDSLLDKAIKQLEETKAELRKQLESSQYRNGKDKLGVTAKLLEILTISISFNELSDLDCLKALTPDAIKDICESSKYKNQIASAIGNLENMVLLATELSPAQLTALIEGLDDALYRKIIKKVKDFKPLTVIFDKERKDIFWQAYHLKLKANIETGEDYRRVAEVLSEVQKKEWEESVSFEELLSVVKNIGDIFHILVSMPPEQRKLFYAAFTAAYDSGALLNDDEQYSVFDKEFFRQTYKKIGDKIESLPEDAERAYVLLYSFYGRCVLWQLAKYAGEHYLFTPFEHLIKDPILTALFPVAPAIILLASLSWLLYEVVKTTWHLISLQSSKLKTDLLMTAVSLTLTTLCSVITVAATTFVALSLAFRSIATVLSPFSRRLPSCRFFKPEHTDRTKPINRLNARDGSLPADEAGGMASSDFTDVDALLPS